MTLSLDRTTVQSQLVMDKWSIIKLWIVFHDSNWVLQSITTAFSSFDTTRFIKQSSLPMSLIGLIETVSLLLLNFPASAELFTIFPKETNQINYQVWSRIYYSAVSFFCLKKVLNILIYCFQAKVSLFILICIFLHVKLIYLN